MVTADERLREFLTECTSLPEKIRKCMFIFSDDRINRSKGDENEYT